MDNRRTIAEIQAELDAFEAQFRALEIPPGTPDRRRRQKPRALLTMASVVMVKCEMKVNTKGRDEMVTIRNTNEYYGESVEFSGETLWDAEQAMQACIRACGPDFEDVDVCEADYEIVD